MSEIKTDKSVTPEYLAWLESIGPRAGVGGNEVWNARQAEIADLRSENQALADDKKAEQEIANFHLGQWELREKENIRLKELLSQALGALKIGRIMGLADDGTYTLDLTPKIQREAIQSIEKEGIK